MLFIVRTSSLFFLITITLTYKRSSQKFQDLFNVAGGEDAHIRDVPYFVRVIVRVGRYSASCGGSYIRPRWVLTAAHCLDINDDNNRENASVGKDMTRAKCYAGMESARTSRYQTSTSIGLFINPNYFRNETEVINDIGLIQLRRPFSMKSTVKLILMPASEIDYGGKSVLIMGWGAAKMDGKVNAGNITSQKRLQTLKMTVHNMAGCREQIGSPSAICLGKRKDISCSGDSGGPLVLENLVIGVCSFGFGCSGSYAVYENVYNHKEWINEIAGKPNCTRCNAGWIIASCSHFIIGAFIILKFH